MKNQDDYSIYKCPFDHVEKECGHELKGPEGYDDVYSVWCACGFRGPVFCLDSEELKLKVKDNIGGKMNPPSEQIKEFIRENLKVVIEFESPYSPSNDQVVKLRFKGGEKCFSSATIHIPDD